MLFKQKIKRVFPQWLNARTFDNCFCIKILLNFNRKFHGEKLYFFSCAHCAHAIFDTVDRPVRKAHTIVFYLSKNHMCWTCVRAFILWHLGNKCLFVRIGRCEETGNAACFSSCHLCLMMQLMSMSLSWNCKVSTGKFYSLFFVTDN